MASDIENKPEEKNYAQEPTEYPVAVALEDVPKGRWERSWPVIACGAGLFSDGYLNGVCSCFLLFRISLYCFHRTHPSVWMSVILLVSRARLVVAHPVSRLSDLSIPC